jgi:hypothetical protein
MVVGSEPILNVMEKLTAAEKIKQMIPADFGISFTQLKKQLLDSFDPVNGSEHYKSKNGYDVFYTNNPNFMQGVKNGGGIGFYAQVRFIPGASTTIKM